MCNICNVTYVYAVHRLTLLRYVLHKKRTTPFLYTLVLQCATAQQHKHKEQSYRVEYIRLTCVVYVNRTVYVT